MTLVGFVGVRLRNIRSGGFSFEGVDVVAVRIFCDHSPKGVMMRGVLRLVV